MDENLAKNFIWCSKSLFNAFILFVKKKNECFEMCVNYYGFNKVIIKNWYSFLLILSLFDQLSQPKIYTKIYLHGAYSLYASKKAMNGRQHFKQGIDTLNIMSCFSNSSMFLLFLNIWWMAFCKNSWTILLSFIWMMYLDLFTISKKSSTCSFGPSKAMQCSIVC
jgi:hypothetical protein